MSDTMKRLMGERIRLVQVRQGLSKAMETGAGGDSTFIPFYLAVSNYFQHAMDRLHKQDIKMLSMLTKKTTDAGIDPGTAISEVYERLNRNLELLAEMTQSADKLNTETIDGFEAISQRYTRYIVENMGHHVPSATLAQQLFSEQDWITMADFSDQATEQEQHLFNEVVQTAPDEIRQAVETVPQIGGPPQ